MPIFLKLLNLDELFHSSEEEPIVLNDLPSKTEKDRDYFNNLVKQTFSSDMISIMPQCQCGELKGEYRLGDTCPECYGQVKRTITNKIDPVVWFRRPAMVEKLINPIFWIMLNQRFNKSNFKVMRWLIDRNYTPTITNGRVPPILTDLLNSGIKRGYNAFVQNFDVIMDFLFDHPAFAVKRGSVGNLVDMFDFGEGSTDPLRELIRQHRDALFSDYLPILNKMLLILDIHATGKYLDISTIDIKDALNTMLSIDQDFYDKSQTVLENRTARIVMMLADYYDEMFQTNVAVKEGLIRQHCDGTRTNFSFRAVITSHEEIHEHDEIWVPWGVGLTTFQPFILNRLMNDKLPYGGMTHNEGVDFIYRHIFKYHPTLDLILKDMIANFPGGSIKCLNQRNPSLAQGSSQLCRITRFKPNPYDQTVSMSDLIAIHSRCN